jgi:membrane protease YdiL (CAAX protease family)
MNEPILIFIISLCLVSYNVVLSLFPPRVHKIAYVPLNLAVTGLLILWAHKAAKFSPEQIGLGSQLIPASALWGALAGLLVGGIIFAVAIFWKSHLPLQITKNFQGAEISGLLYRIIVYIPLGTVLLEEIAFRGVLLQLFLQITGANQAILLQSLVFVFWHIGLLLRIFPFKKLISYSMLMTIAGGAVVIFIGGILFGVLRVYTSSIVGPIVAHWLVNVITVIVFTLR